MKEDDEGDEGDDDEDDDGDDDEDVDDDDGSGGDGGGDGGSDDDDDGDDNDDDDDDDDENPGILRTPLRRGLGAICIVSLSIIYIKNNKRNKIHIHLYISKYIQYVHIYTRGKV